MVLAYSSLEQGAFQSEIRSNSRLVEVMESVCAETGMTAAQVLLNWTLRSPVVITIPRTNTLSRVDENCAASGWRLTDAQWHALTDAAGDRPAPPTGGGERKPYPPPSGIAAGDSRTPQGRRLSAPR